MKCLAAIFTVLLILVCLTEGRNIKDAELSKPTKTPSRTRQGRQHYRRLGKDSVKSNDNFNVLETSEKECHKEALRWCGRSFTKVFKLLPFLTGKQAFNAKCVLREAFFSCLDKVKEKPCRKSRRIYKDDNFRRKLADKLWSTRVCVLGLKEENLGK